MGQVMYYDAATVTFTIGGRVYTNVDTITFDRNRTIGTENPFANRWWDEATVTLSTYASRELYRAIDRLVRAQRLEKITAGFRRALEAMVERSVRTPQELRWTRERERLRPIRQPGLAKRFARIHASAPRQAVPPRTRRRTRTWER